MIYQNLETDRLQLKNISTDDRAFLFKHFSDDAVNAFLFDAEPLQNLAEADDLIDFYTIGNPTDRHRWILRLKQTGEPIGTCGFHCYNPDAQCIDIGYDLQQAFWGRGLMTEAVSAILDTHLPLLGIKQVFAHIAIDNTRSLRLAQKLGFTPSGHTETLTFHGRDYLHQIYVLHVDHL